MYTEINTADMKVQIMSLVTMIFDLPEHAGHVGIKVWETKPAVWLRANQIPANDNDRSGSGHGGRYMIFDLAVINLWLSFLLESVYVRFGDRVQRQIQGTPMGTNCAPHLANFYLASYEHAFLRRLVAIYLSAALSYLHTIVYRIVCSFLFTTRYLDDLASINNPFLEHLLYVDQWHLHHTITGHFDNDFFLTGS